MQCNPTAPGASTRAPDDELTPYDVARAWAKRHIPVVPACDPVDGACTCGGKWDAAQGQLVPHSPKEVGKAPIGTLAHRGVSDATTNTATLFRWWQARPTANVNIELEAAGFVVVDPDSPETEAAALSRGLDGAAVRESRNRAYVFKRSKDCPVVNLIKADGDPLDVLTKGNFVTFGTHATGCPVRMDPDAEPAEEPAWVRDCLIKKKAQDEATEAASTTRRQERAAQYGAGGEPPVRLDGRDLERWRGELVQETDGKLDRSDSLYYIALALAEAGATESAIVAAIQERDVTLGWNKFSSRRDDREYVKMAKQVIDWATGVTPRATILLDDDDGWVKAEETLAEMRNGHAPTAPAKNGVRDDAGDPVAEERRKPQLKMTEMGIAELLVHLHGQDLRYCFPQACWRTWDGRRFLHDLTGEAPRRAKATVRRVYAIAAEIEDDKKRRALLAWAKGLEKSATVTSMLKLAQSEDGIPILPEDMDADPFLFNVMNGTLDLRAGRLRPHDRDDTLTKLAPVAYDQAAECPTFLAFLERVVPDEHIRRFLQRAVGYCLTADTSEQCLFFLHGGGANGKSTFLDVVLALLGEYGKQAAPDLLTHKSGDRHPTELADLFGARLVASVEVDEGKRLAETLVKQMTGGDRMKARYMRGDFFEWAPTHKLLLAANHRPVIRGTDYAIWRRIHLVPFTVTIPEDERDGHLSEKLRAELPGILNWAVEGCLEWRRDGLGVPQAVKDATAEYRAEQDTLGDFLAEKCIRDGQAQETAEKLWGAWKTWCEEGGEKEGTQKGFGLRLAERGFTRGRTKAGRFWQGLRLRGLSEDVQGDAFGPGDAWCRDFPYSSSDSPREADMPKNASSRVTEGNASPDNDPTVCAECQVNGVDMPGLVCDDCMGVAR